MIDEPPAYCEPTIEALQKENDALRRSNRLAWYLIIFGAIWNVGLLIIVVALTLHKHGLI